MSSNDIKSYHFKILGAHIENREVSAVFRKAQQFSGKSMFG
jgi:hypothetical protein